MFIARKDRSRPKQPSARQASLKHTMVAHADYAVLTFVIILGVLNAPLAVAENLRDRASAEVPSACPHCPSMVAIPGSCFQMGSPESEAERDGDESQHEVCVEPFRLAVHEVTQAQWQAVMGENPSEFAGCDDCPVEQVSWQDAQDYIAKLNQQTGQTYRLPTEAEWEYAARAGTTTAHYWGEEIGSGNANCNGCGSRWSGKRTAPVGSFDPNPWGLYDMLGNVWEWTCSAFDETYSGDEKRCEGNNYAGQLAVRGGSWTHRSWTVRAATRAWNDADDRYSFQGLRLAQD